MLNTKSGPRLAFVWENFGPYHHARVLAAQGILGSAQVVPIEMSSATETYAWQNEISRCEGMISLFNDVSVEKCSPLLVFLRIRKLLVKSRVDVVFVPSYWPLRSLAVLLAARSCGCRCVMMNESHAGTAKAEGASYWLKRMLLKLFDAGLVGGTPHLRYFESLGMKCDGLFTGYDCVDNHYFSSASEKARATDTAGRTRFGLPARYLLNLGRMVGKKNLETLIEAFSMLVRRNTGADFHLVLAGSGEREPALKALCLEKKLPVYEHSGPAPAETPSTPGVHFMGFRQIAENAVIYALASVFILPSKSEEWGLVVNEAMASGLPVVVSERAGCAEDLVPAIPHPLASQYELEAGARPFAVKMRRNGFIFDPDSSEELSRQLELLIAKPGLRELMAAESRKIVVNFSPENFTRQAIAAAEHAMRGVNI
jgi:glycosyltransferase involved in cell wall biosynthesis